MGPSPSLTVPLSSQTSIGDESILSNTALPSSLPTHTFKPPLTMAQEVKKKDK